MTANLSSRTNTAALKLIRQLTEDSEFLQNQREDLSRILKERQVFSFYETERTPVVEMVGDICLAPSRWHLP